MYTLLIVDDEQEIREGLSKLIPWADMGFELIGKLEDGREAIDYMNRHSVHAILSDIKMSFESGLNVAKYVYDRGLKTKVVLLSGYQEFNLAHEAIKYSVKHYLLKPSDLNEIIDTFNKIKCELDEENQMDINRISNKNHSEAEHEAGGNTERSRITKARQFINKECHREISLKEVANYVYLNPVYFSRLFKEETQENYSDYLTRVRIDKAKYLLKETPHKIYEICDRIGYKDIKHFHKLFKKMNGLTPNEYRKKFN